MITVVGSSNTDFILCTKERKLVLEAMCGLCYNYTSQKG